MEETGFKVTLAVHYERLFLKGKKLKNWIEMFTDNIFESVPNDIIVGHFTT
jgi:hypothetical protein